MIDNVQLRLEDAILDENVTAMKSAISAGADVCKADAYGATPLHYVAIYERPTAEMATVLIDAGADVNARNENGERPLDIARKRSSHNIIEALDRAEKVIE